MIGCSWPLVVVCYVWCPYKERKQKKTNCADKFNENETGKWFNIAFRANASHRKLITKLTFSNVFSPS